MITIDDIKLTYNTAGRNLVDFRSIVLDTLKTDELTPAWFHLQWSDLLLKGDNHVAIEAFRESAKSQYVTRSFPLYALCYPDKDRDYIVIIKNNSTLAENKLKELENEALSNPFIKERIIKINVESSKVFDVDVIDDSAESGQRNVRIEAYGKGASVRGLVYMDRRPKICIIDDPQDIKDSQSETILENDWQWFMSDVMFLGQSTRIFMIANNLGAKCIIERVFEMAAIDNRFSCHRIPALNDEGQSNWPEKISVVALAKEKELCRMAGTIEVFYRERMCLSIAEETQVFKREYFQYIQPHFMHKIRQGANVYVTVDPASSKSTKSDPRCIVVNAVDSDNNWYIFDIINRRCTPAELVDELFNVVDRWRPIVIAIEQLATLESFIIQEQRRRNIFFKLEELKHHGMDKEVRIKNALQPRFKARSIFFVADAHYLTETESQLLMFPNAKHDDIPDGIAYQDQIAKPPIHGSGSQQGGMRVPEHLRQAITEYDEFAVR